MKLSVIVALFSFLLQLGFRQGSYVKGRGGKETCGIVGEAGLELVRFSLGKLEGKYTCVPRSRGFKARHGRGSSHLQWEWRILAEAVLERSRIEHKMLVSVGPQVNKSNQVKYEVGSLGQFVPTQF